MEELFTYHTRYTKEQVAKWVDKCCTDGTFDDHCKTALKESGDWLTNSIDDTLKSSMRSILAKQPTGPVLWMAIVSEVQADSLRRCQKLEDRFKSLKLANFPGENVQEYAKEADEILVQLEKDNRLPQTHLIDIVDHMEACSVMSFAVQWMSKRTAVEAFLVESNGKDRAAIDAMPNKIHFTDLLESAKKMHNNLESKWGKAAESKSKEQALVGQLKGLTAKVDQMTQQLKQKSTSPPPPKKTEPGEGGGGSGKKKCCWNCGSEDHVKKDCPKLKEKKENNSEKWAAPKDGEPHKRTIEGKERHWCQKCNGGKGRWTLNHNTSQHKADFQKQKKDQGGDGSGNLHCLPVGVLDQTLWIKEE